MVHDQAPEGRQRRQARRACSPRSRARSTVAARQGGGDPDANYRLRLAIEKARSVNMPADNIKRAIEKATGGGEAEQFEEIVYEGYGPGGVAVLVEAATDNRNRTAAEVRSIFAKTGGQLAGSRRGRLAVRAARPDHRPARRRGSRRGRAGRDRRRRRGRRHRGRPDRDLHRARRRSRATRKALEAAGVARRVRRERDDRQADGRASSPTRRARRCA